MSPERIKEVYETRPFVPFRLRLGDGTVVPVPHPELMAFFPGGRTIVVTSRDKLEMIDVFPIAAIEITKARNGHGRRRVG
ncbi:hypothetical protein PHYC_01097 [Phycisphaerales bacterium]|nr:hypothetical protein PHYC_01097 [Phycisphaerales bacterium]